MRPRVAEARRDVNPTRFPFGAKIAMTVGPTGRFARSSVPFADRQLQRRLQDAPVRKGIEQDGMVIRRVLA